MGEEANSWRVWEDLPQVIVDELVEKYAQLIIDRDMDDVYEYFIESLGPATTIFAEVGSAFLAPFLEFGGVDKTAAFFRSRKNIRLLSNRVDELRKEQKLAEPEPTTKSAPEETPAPQIGYFEWLGKKITGIFRR